MNNIEEQDIFIKYDSDNNIINAGYTISHIFNNKKSHTKKKYKNKQSQTKKNISKIDALNLNDLIIPIGLI